MSSKTLRAITSVSASLIVVSLVLSLGPQAQAQQRCTEIRGINQGILPSPDPIYGGQLGVTDVWGGSIYLTLGGTPMIGIFSGNDGSESQHGGRSGHYKVQVCSPVDNLVCGSFTYEVPNSVFGFAPGKVGLGDYKGNTAKIISGDGIFQGASGNLNITGPYILWDDSNSPFLVSGRWNGEISGKICVAP